jgi:phenylalanyl-tRNA synthetase beta chain
MRISLQWLQSFTPGPLDPRAAADALTAGGLNVDAIHGHGHSAVLEVEVTSNRGDCLSHIGVARELAALMGRPFQQPTPHAAEESPAASDQIKVRIDSPDLCPHYTARLIRGVQIAPSPPAIADALIACGLRPINNVVDITNYVLLEMGQPLHAFDFAQVSGGQIIVRTAASGEKLITLDGHTQTLAPSMLVIADATRPLALAGIMGGESSQVTNFTTDILLESARFDPLSIRRTSRALALRSDSSYRFERGIDPTLPLRASLRAAELILQFAGGQLAAGVVSAGAENYHPKSLQLRLSQLERILGINLPAEEVVQALSRLHLSPRLAGQTIEVHVPSWRLDLNIEADLVEEVIRVLGYDRIPVRPEIAIRLQPADPSTAALETIRQTLIAAGFYESVTFSFVSDALKDSFFPPGTHALRADPSVRKADAMLRPSLLPGLLESVRRNETVGIPSARLFEVGSAYLATDRGSPDERRKLALVGGADWHDIRGVVEGLLNKLNADKPIRFAPAARAGFVAGACAQVYLDDKPIGFAGQIDPAVTAQLSLRHTPMAAELDLQELITTAARIPRQRPLPQYPAARRDLSLLVDESVTYEKIEAALAASTPPHLEAIEYVTTFRGKPLEPGKKSVTVTLVFRSESTTLTGEQVESSVTAAIASASEKLPATLRQ